MMVITLWYVGLYVFLVEGKTSGRSDIGLVRVLAVPASTPRIVSGLDTWILCKNCLALSRMCDLAGKKPEIDTTTQLDLRVFFNRSKKPQLKQRTGIQLVIN